MGTDFAPKNLNSGYHTNASLDYNFTQIQTALGRVLNVYGDSTYGTNEVQVDINMNSNQLLNLPSPTLDGHAVSKGYGDANYGGAAATAAAASAAAAAVSEANAAISASNASTSASNASTSETNAATSASNASTSETNAATSETNAATSETNAAQSETDASEWAQYTAGSVPGEGANDYSAKAWAQNVLTGATLGGSAKDWAQTAEDTLVDGGTGYSAFHWAQKAQFASKTVQGTAAKRGALVTKTATQSIPDNAWTPITFGTGNAIEEYDTDNIHDLVTNPTRMSVPSGVTKVQLQGNINVTANATGVRAIRILKNGAVISSTAIAALPSVSAGSDAVLNIATPVYEVSPGDYFTIEVFQNSGGPLNTLATNGDTWIALEVIEDDLAIAMTSYGARGASVSRDTNQSINTGAWTAITLDTANATELYDTDGIHDLVTNPSRFTVPAGVNKIEVAANASFAANTTGVRGIRVTKNGAVFSSTATNMTNALTAGATTLQVFTGQVDATPGDYFEVEVYQTSGGALNLVGGGSSETWVTLSLVNEAVIFADSTNQVKVSSDDAAEGYLLSKISAGTGVTLTEQNGGGNESLEIKQKYVGARAYSQAATTVPQNTWTAVAMELEEHDTDTIHDLVTNNTRVTVPSGIEYVEITGGIGFVSGVAGDRGVRITKNGTATALSMLFLENQAEFVGSVSTGPIAVTGGDYFEVEAYQNGQVNLNTSTAFNVNFLTLKALA